MFLSRWVSRHWKGEEILETPQLFRALSNAPVYMSRSGEQPIDRVENACIVKNAISSVRKRTTSLLYVDGRWTPVRFFVETSIEEVTHERDQANGHLVEPLLAVVLATMAGALLYFARAAYETNQAELEAQKAQQEAQDAAFRVIWLVLVPLSACVVAWFIFQRSLRTIRQEMQEDNEAQVAQVREAHHHHLRVPHMPSPVPQWMTWARQAATGAVASVVGTLVRHGIQGWWAQRQERDSFLDRAWTAFFPPAAVPDFPLPPAPAPAPVQAHIPAPVLVPEERQVAAVPVPAQAPVPAPILLPAPAIAPAPIVPPPVVGAPPVRIPVPIAAVGAAPVCGPH